ncbi:MAG: hypothetical protein R3B72_05745 [Polyangiaceae bacterium]
MIDLDTPAVAALRQRLLDIGGAPSLVLEGREANRQLGHPFEDNPRAKALFDATFELMYLMLEADNRVTEAEELVLRGVARELTEGVVRTQTVLALAGECARMLDREGKDARLAAVAKVLAADTASAEAALVLAAAVAMADEEIAVEEHALLHSLAKLLKLDDARANELLRQASRG